MTTTGTVRAEDRLPVDQWCEGFLDMLGIELAQQKIGRVAFLVAHHHHRNLFGACASCFANTTAFARWCWQMALSLEGLQKERFIGLHNAGFSGVAMPSGLRQETVSPSECRVLADTTALCRHTYGQPLDQSLGIRLPARDSPEASQWSGRQRITGTTTCSAPIAAQPSTPAPRSQLRGRRLTVRAGLQDIVESIFPRWRMQLISELAFLSSVEAWELTQPMLKGERVHRRYLGGHVSLKVALQHATGT